MKMKFCYFLFLFKMKFCLFYFSFLFFFFFFLFLFYFFSFLFFIYLFVLFNNNNNNNNKRIEVLPLLTQRFFLIYTPQLATLAASYKLKRIRGFIIYKKFVLFFYCIYAGGGYGKKTTQIFTT